jgi:guanosine-3',5'-bis(diphosphate) 3'-pyrophosphohydrolase
MDATPLLEKVKQYLPPEKLPLIEAAYKFAAKAHEGQVRKSGDPFLEHPLETAMILADLQLDASTIAAALLHDVTEDCGIPLSDIESKFSPEIRKLVEGVTKLGRLSWRRTDEEKKIADVENLRKMLLAMAEDLRVVFIKLADRLHNMRTLAALPSEKRRIIARETLDIYAPLAHRLGIREVKWQLEDWAFRYLEPQQYRKVANLLSKSRKEREEYVAETTGILEQALEKANIKAEVQGRPKHLYSIYHKINKYAALGKDFHDIQDLIALRVLVDSIPDCYKALGVIHNLWHPIPEEFSDHIANPKGNGYQSLHTTVLRGGNTPLEVQIRTYDMHKVADYGVAAHWRYKEGTKSDEDFEDKITWLRQLTEWQGELSSEQFMESLKTDIFSDQVFVYTPKGEIKALPRGASPLDFAYHIHTELGHRCIGTKVNGKLVPLNHELKNGDIVEIMVTKADKGPSLDWLNPDLGYVRTSHGKEKVRQWFKKQERTQNIERGRELLERELKRLNIIPPNTEDMARLFNCDTYEDVLASLGSGLITAYQLTQKLAGEPEPPPFIAKVVPAEKPDILGIQVLGVGDLLTRLAACCNPLPGDDIIGFITRSQGITVHRKDCPNIVSLKETERLIEVKWGQVHEVYPVNIEIEAWNRVGVLRDIAAVIAEENVNISTINTESHGDASFVFLTLNINDISQLTHLLSRVRSVRGVISAARSSHTKATINS